MKQVIFIPTYNESENILPLYEKIKGLGLDTDLLLLDDTSPDGTGKIMDAIAAKDPRVNVIHRKGKLGIGSAHKDGISWAYRHNYTRILTMDADFTHMPETIPKLLAASENADIVVASRYLQEESLQGWNIGRKSMTKLAHVLTTVLLGLKQDSTGAFRVYRLDRIPFEFLAKVQSNGYSFFFESLFVLNENRFRIVEVPNTLPPRTYGSSKMDVSEIFKSVRQLLQLFLRKSLTPKQVLIEAV